MNDISCPKCETMNPADSSFCKACGEALKQRCPNCGTENAVGVDSCPKCGQNLNKLDELTARHAQGYRGVLEEQRRMATALKARERVEGSRRTASLWEDDRKRQEEIDKQQAQQQAQQTRILIIVGILAVIFILAAILIVARMAR
jgi:predicted amidophosphoribosyltransferase